MPFWAKELSIGNKMINARAANSKKNPDGTLMLTFRTSRRARRRNQTGCQRPMAQSTSRCACIGRGQSHHRSCRLARALGSRRGSWRRSSGVLQSALASKGSDRHPLRLTIPQQAARLRECSCAGDARKLGAVTRLDAAGRAILETDVGERRDSRGQWPSTLTTERSLRCNSSSRRYDCISRARILPPSSPWPGNACTEIFGTSFEHPDERARSTN